MPLDYHPQHCPCRECRDPADRDWTAEWAQTIGCFLVFVGFSLAVVAFANFMTGAGQ